MEAQITLQYNNARIARAIAKAVSPDNVKTPAGLSIRTMSRENAVITKIAYTGKLATFTATIDDLLFCASAAEKALRVAESL